MARRHRCTSPQSSCLLPESSSPSSEIRRITSGYYKCGLVHRCRRDRWLVDTGAQVHICNNRRLFVEFQKTASSIRVGDTKTMVDEPSIVERIITGLVEHRMIVIDHRMIMIDRRMFMIDLRNGSSTPVHKSTFVITGGYSSNFRRRRARFG
jgi:hypothetical protein